MCKMFENIFKAFLTVYAVIKDFLVPYEVREHRQFTPTKKYITLFLTIAYFLVTFFLLLPLILFRICLGVFLYVSHGNEFGGFLNGADALFETDKTVMNAVIIISFEDSPSELYQHLTKLFTQLHNSSYKFSCKIKQLLGYCYFVKNQIKIDDVVEDTKYNHDKYMSKDMLYDYIEKQCDTMRKNQMWRVVFFSQPIKWSADKNGRKKQYAVIITFRHSLGDGPTITGMLRKYLSIEEHISQSLILNSNHAKTNMNLNKAFVYRNPLTMKPDKALLKTPTLTNWHIAAFTETERKYIPLIKKIKKELNVGFSDVLGAAICASVSDYIIQRKVDMESFTMGAVVRVMDKELVEIINGTYNFDSIINNAANVTLSIPVKKQSMKDYISHLHKNNQILKKSIDYYVTYGFIHYIFTCLPIFLIRFFEETFFRITLGFTNMTGFPKCSFYGISVDDMFCCTPKFLNIGFTFSVLSYDGKLQLSVTSGEGYMHNRQELQDLLDNVFKKINIAVEEIFPSP